jgi:hypothetical protein
MMKTVITVLAVGLAMLTTPLAHADSADDAFLKALADNGIYDNAGDADSIRNGHAVCEAFYGGDSYDDVAKYILKNTHTLTPTSVRVIITAAVGAYCPVVAPRILGGA